MDLIPKDILKRLREAFPNTALRAVFVDDEALTEDELENPPGVVIRRMTAKDWEALGLNKQSIFEQKQLDERIVDRCVILTLGCYKTTETLFEAFPMFRFRVAEQVYRFSGLGDPFSVILPLREKKPD